jgi:hypothetical protein
MTAVLHTSWHECGTDTGIRGGCLFTAPEAVVAQATLTRRLPQLSLKLRDPLPRPLQLRPRLRQLTAQRHHQRREHLG